MPKIYEYFGLVFLFYSNDHKPVHVHVKNGEKETKFVFVYSKGMLVNIKQIDSSIPLTTKQKNEAIKFIQKFHLKITSKWYDFFVLNKKSNAIK
jgi:hypothetical protein